MGAHSSMLWPISGRPQPGSAACLPPLPLVGNDEIWLSQQWLHRYLGEGQLCSGSGAQSPSLMFSAGWHFLKSNGLSRWEGLGSGKWAVQWVGRTCHLLHCG